MSPIGRPYTSFYRHSVVALVLGSFVSEMSLVLYRKCHACTYEPRLSSKIWRCFPSSVVVMLFSENINLFNHSVRTFQTGRHADGQSVRENYCGNTGLCTKVHRAVKTATHSHILKLEELRQCIPPPRHFLPVSRYGSGSGSGSASVSPPNFNHLFIGPLPCNLPWKFHIDQSC